MNIAKSVAAAVAVVSFALAGCGGGGGVEGTYKLDKTEMKKAMEAEIAKMPADQQGLAKLGLLLIEAMDITMELKPDGKLTAKSTAPSLDEKQPMKTKEENGTWKMEGNNVILDTGDGKPAKCAVSPGKLTCEPEKAGDPPMVLIK